MSPVDKLDKLLEEIKNTADRFTFFYVDKDQKDTISKIKSKDFPNSALFILDSDWVDYQNGLKAKILEDATHKDYVVTIWKCYRTTQCPKQLHFENKSLYVIAGALEEISGTGLKAHPGESIIISSGVKHILKIYTGTVFITTFHVTELTGNQAKDILEGNGRHGA